MFGADEENQNESVRTADNYNYDMLVGGPNDSIDMHGNGQSCCELICGRPHIDEPKVSLVCCSMSKRVIKNAVMFVVVLLIYIFFLSLIMGSKKAPS